MIVFLHPRSTSPRSRRFPLSILSIAAVVEGRVDYTIVDGNVETDPLRLLLEVPARRAVDLLAVSVMPGPQMAAAIPLCRSFRERYPRIPILWGGYFPSLYPDAALNADYVDLVARGQGEDTFVELLPALRRGGALDGIRGLSYKDPAGRIVHNPERGLRSPDDYPMLPYNRLDASRYLLPTYLGSRTAVHQASVGCPFSCNFCGVATVARSRQKMESPARTAAVLEHLKECYGADAVQFYDNNFFLGEGHAREQAERLTPLQMRWWCEGRIDTLLGYSDLTLRALKRSGCTMIFFGAESGSDWVLRQMNKKLRAEQTLALAARIRSFGIVPEFSFVVGNPEDPERDSRECIAFIRRLKKLNPEAEIIIQHYTPTPQREAMYGGVDGRIRFPTTPEEWATERWYNFIIRKDPRLPWLPDRVRRRIDQFELVVSCRWPTIQDLHLRPWGKALLRLLGSWRYLARFYAFPRDLEWAQHFVKLRKPRVESL